VRRWRWIIAPSPGSNGVADCIGSGCPDKWLGHLDLELNQREFLHSVGGVERLSRNIGFTKSDSQRYLNIHVDVYWCRWFRLRQRECDRMERARAHNIRGSNQYPEQQYGGTYVVVTEYQWLHWC
jgi:hypothetical protein